MGVLSRYVSGEWRIAGAAQVRVLANRFALRNPDLPEENSDLPFAPDSTLGKNHINRQFPPQTPLIFFIHPRTVLMSTIGEKLAMARAKLFGAAAPDTPIPFELPCDCGHTVAGIRRPRIQITHCSACGQSLFVLPTDRYPVTRRSPRKPPHTEAASRATPTPPEEPAATPDTAPAWASNNAAPAETTTRRSSKRPNPTSARSPQKNISPGSPNTLVTAKDKPSPSQTPASTTPPPPQLAPPKPSISVKIRRTFTPFRLLTAGCLTLLLLTATWMVHQRQLENARRTWRREFDATLKAEAERNLSALQQSLQNALRAADILQKQDSDVTSARSLLQQCNAISQLTAVDPIAVLNSHFRPDREPDPEQLTTELRGLVLLFDASPQPAPDPAPNVLLDLPLVIHGRLLQLSARSQILHQFSQRHPGQSVLFLAAIRSCQLTSDASSALQLDLDPDSITLLTSEFLATEAGLSSDSFPELPQILLRQSSLITPSTAETSPPPVADSTNPAKAATP